jgi:hypothetical protein
MNLPATQKLIAAARDRSNRPEDVGQAAQEFLQATEKISPREMEAELSLLAQHFDLPAVERGAFLARMGGALVERGCDPLPMARPLRLRLLPLLEDCARLAEACRMEMSELEEGAEAGFQESDELSDEDGDELDDRNRHEAFEKVRQKVAPRFPKENAAWEALHTFWLPAIAVYSVCPEARWAAQALREPAQKIADFHEGGHWIQLILSVLDNEPLLVVEPETRRGMLARSFGVVDNFQLNTLLMDVFPGTNSTGLRRVSWSAAETARGNGPQVSEEVVTGVWNLYDWRALRSDLRLPDAEDYDSEEYWIWNEGIPADIPVIDDRRVILLGPASFSRSWRSQRMFDRLRAQVHIEKQLTPEETTAWLQRIAAAAR